MPWIIQRDCLANKKHSLDSKCSLRMTGRYLHCKTFSSCIWLFHWLVIARTTSQQVHWLSLDAWQLEWQYCMKSTPMRLLISWNLIAMSVLKPEVLSYLVCYLGPESWASLRKVSTTCKRIIPARCSKPDCKQKPRCSCDRCCSLLCHLHISFSYDEYMQESRYCMPCQRGLFALPNSAAGTAWINTV